MLRTDEQGTPCALSLVPLDDAVHLRPSFAEIDTAESEGKVVGRKADDEDAEEDDGGDTEEEDEEEDTAGGATSVAPQFRPAQTEREIEARRSSHAYLVEQRESEPWSAATLFSAESAESRAVRDACFLASE